MFLDAFLKNIPSAIKASYFCQTPVLGLGIGVDFVFPPSQVTSNKSLTLTKIYLKEVKYRQGIWHLDLTHKLRPGDNCQELSLTILRMVTHQSKDSYPPDGCILYRQGIWHLDLSHKTDAR